MIFINDISINLFSINGISYVKNYICIIVENQLKIVNYYNSIDVKVEFTNFNNFTINGIRYTDITTLKTVISPILFKNQNISNTLSINKITRYKGINNLKLNIWQSGDVGIGFLNNGTFLMHCFYTGLETDDNNLIQNIANWNGDIIDTYLTQ